MRIVSITIVSIMFMAGAIAQPLSAQSERVPPAGADAPAIELFAAYGFASAQELYTHILGDPAVDGPSEIGTRSRIGPIILGARHYLSNRISVGAEASYASFEKEYVGSWVGNVFTYTTSFATVMANVDLHWLDAGFLRLSSGGAAGIAYESGKSTDGATPQHDILFAYQVSPLRVWLGSGAFGVFAEGGIGYRGFVTVGASLRL